MTANNIFLKPGQIFRVVKDDEPLQEHFLVREMYEDNPNGGGWGITFRLYGWLGTAWHTVKDELPAWIGQSYNDLKKAADGNDLRFNHEIIEIIEL